MAIASTKVRIGSIAGLWRYPVKSMGGEPLAEAEFDLAGLAGDRRFAVTSSAAPPGKPLLASRERTLMLTYGAGLASSNSGMNSAVKHGTNAPRVTAPDGTEFSLQTPELAAELLDDVRSRLGGSTNTATQPPALAITCSAGHPLTDVRPLAMLANSTVAQLSAELGRAIDPQRFRSNLIVDLDLGMLRNLFGALPLFAESILATHCLHLGAADSLEAPQILIREAIPRCRIVSLDPATAAVDASILPHLARHHGGRCGVYATVVRVGFTRVADPILLQL